MTALRIGCAILALVVATATARADADEASLEVHTFGGMARIADPAAEGSATAPLFGLAVRASYATRDWLQYEIGVAAAGTTSAEYDDGHFEPPGRPPADGAFEVASQLARVELGATFRLGVRYVPRLRVFVGPQVRRVGPATMDDASVRDASYHVGAFAGGGLGLDYRIGSRLVVGIDAVGTYAVDTRDAIAGLEVSAHLSYYWYPR